MLDDCDARLGEVEHRPARGIGVDVVVVAHFLAGQLLGLRESGWTAVRDVQRSALVGILAVAESSCSLPGASDPAGKAAAGVIRRDDVA
jgi:hypothetical protein